jgi:metallo-beta-lactamase family protein
VLLVGYQAPGTLGRLLEDGASQVSIRGEHISVKAAIRRIDVYSGHADRDDLRRWAEARLPVRQNVFLVHGEEASLAAQRETLISLGLAPDRVIIPALDQRYRLDAATGAQALAPVAPRLSEEKAEAARKGWDWTNDYAALSLDLKAFLQGLSDDRARQQALREFRRLMQKRA